MNDSYAKGQFKECADGEIYLASGRKPSNRTLIYECTGCGAVITRKRKISNPQNKVCAKCRTKVSDFKLTER